MISTNLLQHLFWKGALNGPLNQGKSTVTVRLSSTLPRLAGVELAATGDEGVLSGISAESAYFDR